MTTASDRLVGLLGDMLDNAQTIRIIQVQSRIAKRYKEKADVAWEHLNAVHKAMTELLQLNGAVGGPPTSDTERVKWPNCHCNVWGSHWCTEVCEPENEQRDTANASVTGAAKPRTVDAVLAEIQASSELAWEHAQEQEAAGNIVRAEWFKGRSVALGEVVQELRNAQSHVEARSAESVQADVARGN